MERFSWDVKECMAFSVHFQAWTMINRKETMIIWKLIEDLTNFFQLIIIHIWKLFGKKNKGSFTFTNNSYRKFVYKQFYSLLIRTIHLCIWNRTRNKIGKYFRQTLQFDGMKRCIFIWPIFIGRFWFCDKIDDVFDKWTFDRLIYFRLCYCYRCFVLCGVFISTRHFDKLQYANRFFSYY